MLFYCILPTLSMGMCDMFLFDWKTHRRTHTRPWSQKSPFELVLKKRPLSMFGRFLTFGKDDQSQKKCSMRRGYWLNRSSVSSCDNLRQPPQTSPQTDLVWETCKDSAKSEIVTWLCLLQGWKKKVILIPYKCISVDPRISHLCNRSWKRFWKLNK